MHRFEHGRMGLFWVHVSGWSDGNCACTGRAEIGKDIAEEITTYNRIKVFWHAYEVCGEYVNVELVNFHIWVVFTHFFKPRIPVRH